MKKDTDITLGFIGQGWIGKNYADHFEDPPSLRHGHPHAHGVGRLSGPELLGQGKANQNPTLS